MEITASIEIYGLAVWLQALFFATWYNYNAANLHVWWTIALALTLHTCAFDFFILLSYLRRGYRGDAADRRLFAILQFVVICLVSFQAGLLYTLTIKELVNCPLNSYVVTPLLGFAVSKFAWLDVLSFSVLAIRLSRLFAIAGSLFIGDEDEGEECDSDCEEEDILKVHLLGIV